jgi:hypothetical protein
MLRAMVDDEDATDAGLLDDLNHASVAGTMPAVLDRLRPAIGAIGIRMLVVDLEEARLEDRRILRAGRGIPDGAMSVEHSPHGAAYRSGRPQVVQDQGRTTVIVPVTARQVREGVVEVVIDRPSASQHEVDPCPDGGAAPGLRPERR